LGNANAKDLLGQDVRTLKDATGKAFGQEICAAGQKLAGEITEVSYLFAKPSDPKPSPKTSFVTKVDDDFACGVGCYKQSDRRIEHCRDRSQSVERGKRD
jgi:signal transduction histidine kinase